MLLVENHRHSPRRSLVCLRHYQPSETAWKVYNMTRDYRLMCMICTLLEKRRFFVELEGERSRWRSQITEERLNAAPTFITSTTFVAAHQFCQFISTAFVNLTTFVKCCHLRAHQFCQQYQPLMSLKTRSLRLSTRPDHFCQP